MLAILGLLSGLLSFLCYFPYIRDILLHKTKPERASWLIWSVLGGIAFFSQLAKGATNSLWLAGVQAFGVIIVFLLSLRFGTGGLVKKDYIALFFAGVGLMIWYFTKEAATALFIIIGVDGIGSVLTAHKAYLDPESETVSTWILAGLSGFFAILSVGSFNIVLLSYPIYIFLINLIIVSAILLGKRK